MLLWSAPALTRAEDATTVVCKDGATSKGGKGACSGHGGVDKAATKAAHAKSSGSAAAQPAAPATPPAASQGRAAPHSAASSGSAPAKNTDPTGAIARCKDGTYSHAKGHSGACSSHGGVAEWLDQQK
jgi:hypothetical protein